MCCLQIGAAKFYNWKGMHSDVKGMMALLLPLLTVHFFFYYKLPTRPTSNKPSILKNVRILHVGLFPSCRAGSSPLAASCTTMAIISTFMPQCHRSSVHHQLVRFLELGMCLWNRAAPTKLCLPQQPLCSPTCVRDHYCFYS